MPGLASYALAGALGGLGEGITERSAALREAALANLKRQQGFEDRIINHQIDAAFKGKGGSGGGGGGGGGSSSGGGSSGGSKKVGYYDVLSDEEKADLGLPADGVYQRNGKTGNITRVAGTGSSGSSADTSYDGAIRDALRSAGIPTPDGAIMAEIRARVAGGEDAASVVADLDAPDEVTNKAGTMVSRGLGLVDENAPPDATKKGRPTGFKSKGVAPSDEAPSVSTDAPAQPSGPALKRPKIGAIVEGYRYIGGDPNDMASWEKV